MNEASSYGVAYTCRAVRSRFRVGDCVELVVNLCGKGLLIHAEYNGMQGEIIDLDARHDHRFREISVKLKVSSDIISVNKHDISKNFSTKSPMAPPTRGWKYSGNTIPAQLTISFKRS